MKSKNCKQHNHNLTKFLKVFIYMLVMLAPFIAIGVKCWYVATNKNAKDSYTGTYQFDTLIELELTNTNQGIYEEYYYNELSSNMFFTPNGSNRCSTIINFEKAKFVLNNNLYNLNKGCIRVTASFSGTDNLYFAIYNSNKNIDSDFNDYIQETSLGATTLNLNLTWIQPYDTNYQSIFNVINNNNIAPLRTIETTTFVSYSDNTLSSVFYAAVDELDDASIFSWTTNTAIYTAINNMCNTLGIVSPPLAVLLTYWSLITVIYVIIDIVIEAFVYLTHWFNDKMV